MMINIVRFFVITMAMVRCSACPVMCVCHNYSKLSTDALTEYTNAHCNRPGISSKHPDSPRCLEVSNLNETEVRYFVEDLLADKARPTCKTQLRLVYSVIPDNITFSDLDLVETLDLPENQIEDLEQIVFNLTNLKQLDVSNNSLKIINNRPFRLLKSLKYLNLSANSIFDISSDSFHKLSVLVNLDIAKNNLSSLSDGVFQEATSLQYLNLSHNNFETLNENCFRNLLELQELDLSFNKLVQVSSAIHLPSLTSVNLNGNPALGISEEPYLFLITGSRLQVVDACYIGLKQIPAALTISIRILKLVGNSINTIRRGDFDSYPLLQFLDFSSNGLVLLEYDALGRLNYLTVLYLKNNSLHELPKSLPENLKILNMERNKIQSLNGKDLEEMHHLEVLFLNDNNISSISSNAFNNLESLKTLDISDNPIITLESGCLWGPKDLRHLRLSYLTNQLTDEIPLNSLIDLKNLISLDLSRSPQLIANLFREESLNASKEIEELNIANATITDIPQYLLLYLRKLRVLHLEGNKLDCSNLRWLAMWMRQNSPNRINDQVTCFSPPELNGIPLKSLDKDKPDVIVGMRNKIVVQPLNSTKHVDILKNVYSKDRNQELLPNRLDHAFTESSNNRKNNSPLRSLNVNTVSAPEASNEAETEWNSPDRMKSALPDASQKQNYSFQSTFFIVIEVFTMVLLVGVLVFIRIFRRKKFTKVLDRQEEEMFNSSSVIELW